MEINESKKKRKVSDGDDEQQNNEEAEMQIFFALINNIREARLRLMNGSNVVLNAAGMDQNDDNRTSSKKKKKLIEEEEEKEKEKERSKQMFNSAAVRKPSLVFQRQDLREEAQFKIPTSQISSGGEKGKITDCNLDLTLSL
ncbi:putative NPR1/NH1-interacting protein [Rosa chinensis]|uniref:Putative NPR1/NH1-interacting protein n=1 Tax=Rosa chinensis TaxID=74649 RepID=A0A2P6RFD1_ROSCH|nr:putative NPR1/NH1-interacting protein [Rosa chinensis]